MPLASMTEIIGPARAAGRGVGAFNVIGIEHAEAIVAGAEIAGAPVVLQISENCVAYHGALEPIAARLPCARALGRGPGRGAPGSRRRARSWSGRPPTLGIGSVMFDASSLPYQENVRVTADVDRVVPRPGHLGRGRAWRDRRQERRALAARPHRPGRGGRVRRRHRG